MTFLSHGLMFTWRSIINGVKHRSPIDSGCAVLCVFDYKYMQLGCHSS